MKKTEGRHRSASIYSDFLRRRPSFLTGFASIFDFAGNLHRYEYDSGPDADARALASDWQAIGDDLWIAMGQFEEETGVRVLEKWAARERV